MDGRYAAPPFAGDAGTAVGRARARAVEEGVELARPVLHRRGGRLKAGARILPYSVIGRQTHVEEGARSSTARSSGRTAGSAARRRSAARSSAATATSAATPCVETPRRARRQDRPHRLQQAMTTSIHRHDLQGLRRPRPLSVRDQRGRRAR